MMAGDPISLLGDDGTIREHPQFPVPTDADLPAMYRDMVITRAIDTEAIRLQRQGELGLWASPLGQEAAQVGAAHALADRDFCFPTYREHGVAWCRGIPPIDLLGLFRGTSMGGWDAERYRTALYTIVIGAQTLHAVGYAMGIVRDGDVGTHEPDRDRAVLAFLGDGALSEGETNEAFVWAAAQSLPVVFFCQNNQWAISTPQSVQARVPVAQRARGFGFKGLRIDGNDPLVCLAATRQALDAARSGQGPTLIEAFTYRRNPHTTSDDDTRYRSGSETDHWAELDPVDRLRRHLTASGAADDAWFEQIDAEASALARALRADCLALPDPDPADPFDHTYAEPTAELLRQREEHLAFIGSLTEGAES